MLECIIFESIILYKYSGNSYALIQFLGVHNILYADLSLELNNNNAINCPLE